MSESGCSIVLLRSPEDVAESFEERLRVLVKEFDSSFTIDRHSTDALPRVDANVTLLIFETDQFGMASLGTIADLRGMGYRGPILVLFSKFIESEIRGVPNLEKIAFMPKSTPDFHLEGIVRRLLCRPDLKLRSNHRYVTRQDAELYTKQFVSGEPCRIANISAGGACVALEPDRKIPLVGEQVTLGLNSTRAYHARVQWTNTARGELGLSFVHSGIV